MNRLLSLAAAAAAIGLALPALAQSSVSVYGLIDVSAGRFQPAGTESASKAESGAMSTSFLGFKGSEDLGGTLKARFAIEHEFRADEGRAGRYNGEAFWGRNAYVGLEGEFGSSLLGRNTTPLFVSTLAFNAIGDSFGFSPSIRQLFTPATGLAFYGDTAWNNSLLYSSAPNDNGYGVSLIGNLGEGAPGATGRNVGGNLLYSKGPLAATFAFQQVKNGAVGAPPGWDRQDTVQLGSSYDFGPVKLYGQYSRVKTHATIDGQTRLYGLGASVPLGNGKLVAQYGHAKTELPTGDVTQKTFTAGYDYALSKLTDAYAMWMNDRLSNASNGNSVATGIRLRF